MKRTWLATHPERKHTKHTHTHIYFTPKHSPHHIYIYNPIAVYVLKTLHSCRRMCDGASKDLFICCARCCEDFAGSDTQYTGERPPSPSSSRCPPTDTLYIRTEKRHITRGISARERNGIFTKHLLRPRNASIRLMWQGATTTWMGSKWRDIFFCEFMLPWAAKDRLVFF